MMKLFVILSLYLIHSSHTQECEQNYEGSELLLYFPNVNTIGSMRLYLYSSDSNWVWATVSAPLRGENFGAVFVRNNRAEITTIENRFQVSSTGITDRVIAVRGTASGSNANARDLQVNVKAGDTSCAGFQVIPTESLGTDYYVITQGNGDGESQIGVIAAEAGETTVTISLPPGVSVSYDGQIYTYNRDLVVALQQYEVFHLQDNQDMTGVRVTAGNKIAVFGGRRSTEFANEKEDSTFDQMPPIHSWGTTFGLVPFPGQSSEYYVTIVSKVGNTEIFIGMQSSTLTSAGGKASYTLDISQTSVIRSSQPILVSQMTKVVSDNLADFPAAAIVAPLEQYRSTYSFVFPYMPESENDMTLTRYAMLVARVDRESDITLDDNPLVTTWTEMDTNSVALTGTVQHLDYRYKTLRSSNPFGLMVYGTASNGCGYAFTPDMCLADISQTFTTSAPTPAPTATTTTPTTTTPTTTTPTTTTPTTTTPTTTTPTTTTPTTTTPTTTTSVPTTTTSVPTPSPAASTISQEPTAGTVDGAAVPSGISSGCEALDYIGMEFVVVVMENEKERDVQLEIFPTMQSDERVMVTIDTPRLTGEDAYFQQVFISTGGYRLTIPNKYQIQSDGRVVKTDSVFRITATRSISVVKLNKAAGSCGASTLLPTSSLTEDYYTVMYHGSTSNTQGNGQIVVIALKTSTVNIVFKESTGVQVVYESSVYGAANPSLSVELLQYEAIVLVDSLAGDLSGTSISGPVAVFAGNSNASLASGDNWGQLTEQMAPLHTWGQEFTVMANPTREVDEQLKIVARNAGTKVNVTTESGSRELELVSDGSFKTVHMSPDEDVHLSADNPIMVAQFIKGLVSGNSDNGGDGCSDVVADIVLLVDVSGTMQNRMPARTVSSENFSYLLSFIANFLQNFDLSSGKARFGLVTFAETVENRFYLKSFTQETRLLSSIYAIQHEGGHTNISGALRVAQKEQFVEANGDRSDAPNFAVLVTYNGGTIDTDKTSPYSQELEASGVRVFSIGITERVSEGELSLLSARPKRKHYNYFMVPAFSQLHGVEANIVKQIEWYKDYDCALWEGEPVADIIFLMDSSGSIENPNPLDPVRYPQNYDFLRGFIADVIGELEIGENGFRVGLVRFSNTGETIFPLNYYYSQAKMAGVVRNIPYVGGTTNTSGAIREMLAHQFTPQNGDRPNVPNIAILITDGDPNVDALRTTPDAEAARRAGIYLMAIGVTPSVGKQALASLASCPQRETESVFFSAGFNTMSSELVAMVTGQIHRVLQRQCGDLQAVVCTDSKLDLVFVVDSSGSISEANPDDGSFDNYELLKDFISNLIGFLDIGSDKIRVGLLIFSNLIRSEYYLNTSFNKTALQERTRKIGYIGGTTNTSGALHEMRAVHFTEANGDRPDVPNVAIVITDGGSSDDTYKTIPEAELAHEEGINIISVGITGKINITEIKGISSPPHLSGQNYFISDDFRSLDVDVKDALVTVTCTAVSDICVGSQADLVFVVDSSGSIRENQQTGDPDNYDMLLQFVAAVVSLLPIGQNGFQVGLVRFSNTGENEFFMTDYDNAADLSAAILRTTFMGGNTNTSGGIRRMHHEQFTRAGGDRDGVPNIAIVITDGVSTYDTNRTVPDAVAARADGIQIYSIGITDKINENEIRLLSSRPQVQGQNFFRSIDFSNLNEIVLRLTELICSSTQQLQGDPIMVLIPPQEQYRNYYCFPAPAAAKTYVQLVAEEDHVTGLIMDGVLIVSRYVPLPGGLFGSFVEIASDTDQTHCIYHQDKDKKFGAVVFGYDTTCGFGFGAGMCMDVLHEVTMTTTTPATTTTTTPATTTTTTEATTTTTQPTTTTTQPTTTTTQPTTTTTQPTTTTTQPTTTTTQPTTTTTQPTTTTTQPTTTTTEPTTTTTPTTEPPTTFPIPDDVCVQSNAGTEFVLMFLENADAARMIDFFAVSDTVSVNVYQRFDLKFSGELVPGEEKMYRSDLRSIGTGYSNSVLYVNASGPIVVRSRSLQRSQGCGAFMALPLAGLGRNYHVLSYKPPRVGSQFGVVATKAETTTVRMILPTNPDIQVEFSGMTYFGGDTIKVTLNTLQAIQIQDTNLADLSGTLVIADEPVAVFSGNRNVGIPDSDSIRGHTVEQLPPISTWGTRFVAINSPGTTSPDVYTFVAAEDDTSISIPGQDALMLASRGDSVQFDITSSVLVTSSKPVLVARFQSGFNLDGQLHPTMSIVVPVSQYMYQYTFIVHKAEEGRVFAVIPLRREDELLLDGVLLSNLVPVAVSSGTGPVMQVVSFTVQGGPHHLKLRRNEKFEATVYVSEMDSGDVYCTYAHPVGFCLDDIYTEYTPPMEPTTTEQQTTTIPASTASLPEDICTLGNEGTEFVVTVMWGLIIFEITPLYGSVDINFYKNFNLEASITVESGEKFTRRLFLEALVGSGISTEVVYVNATGPIVMSGFTPTDAGCGEFVSLPVSGLGSQYHVVAYAPASLRTQFIVIAAKPGLTTVTILFYRDPNIQVEFKGQTYSAGDTLQLTLTYLEALHIQDSNLADLSGTRILADKPVAVYSGNAGTGIPDTDSAPDLLVEQLMPISTWGTRFAFTNIPGSTGQDYYKFVAAEPNTNITIPGQGSLMLENFGDSVQVQVRSSSIVTSNKPVMVVKFPSGLTVQGQLFPSMSIVVPISQYRYQYTFSFVGSVATVTAIIPLGLDRDLLLNGNPLLDLSTTPLVSETGLAMQVVSFDVDPGVHHLRLSTNEKFGATIYWYGVACTTARPIGFCLDEIFTDYTPPQLTTTTTTEPTTTTTEPTTTTTEPTTTTTEPTTTTTEATTTTTEATTTTTEATTSTTEATTTSTESPPEDVCEQTNFGRFFLLMFLDNGASSFSVEVIAAPHVANTVTLQLQSSGFTQQTFVEPNQVAEIVIPDELRNSGTGLFNTAINISASHDVAVFGDNSADSGCGGFLVLPSDSLGMYYYVASYGPPSEFAQFGVVASDELTTTVQITLPDTEDLEVVYDGFPYSSGDRFQVVLEVMQVLQIRETNSKDLTGTLITANHKIAVFAGNKNTAIPEASSPRDHLVEQLVPVTTWGQRFAVTRTPSTVEGRPLQDTFKFVASEDNTILSVPGQSGVMNLAKAGDSVTLDIDSYLIVSSDKPIFTVRFTYGSRLNAFEPMMSIVPPISQYLYQYSFTTLGSDEAVVSVILPRGREQDIYLDGERVAGLTFEGVSTALGIEMITATLPVSKGYHYLRLRNNEKFLATVFKPAGNDCGFAYPAGLCLESINSDYTPPVFTTTTTEAPTTTEATTTTKPTTTTEPTTTTAAMTTATLPEDICSTSSFGLEFVAIFLDNVESITYLQMVAAPDVSSSTAINVIVPNVLSQERITLVLEPEQTEVVEIQTARLMNGTGLYENGILVTASNPISVTGLDAGFSACGAFLVLPTSALGSYYHALTWWPTRDLSEVRVVATQDQTELTIVLPELKSTERLTIEFEGHNYTNSETMRVTMSALEVFRIASSGDGDLSGIFVRANEPVAVFSGNRAAGIPLVSSVPVDQVVEQMTPISTWGTQFVVTPTSDATVMDVFRMVAAEDDTRVIVEGDPVFLNAGEPTTFRVQFAQEITSDKPILVARFIASELESFSSDGSQPAMAVIPPTSQFLYQYSFSTEDTDDAALTLIVPFGSRVMLDGEMLDISFSEVMRSGLYREHATIPVSPGRHTLKLASNHKFGAFLSLYVGSCGLLTPIGMCLEEIYMYTPPTTTTSTTTEQPTTSTMETTTTAMETTTSTMETTTTAMETTTMEPTTTKMETTTTAENVCLCDPVNDGFFENIQDCNSFCKCNAGQSSVMGCSPGLHFQINISACVDAATANCEMPDVVDSYGDSVVIGFPCSDVTLAIPTLAFDTNIPNVNVMVNQPLNEGFVPLNQEFGRAEGPAVSLGAGVCEGRQGLSTQAVQVDASEAVSVVASVGPCAGAFLPLPMDVLGTEYYAASWNPRLRAGEATLVIIATKDATEIIIDNGSSRTAKTIDAAFEMFITNSEFDLTGAHITSNHPIAVTSGSSDHFSYLHPVPRWGSQFVVPALPLADTYSVKLVASADNTEINLLGEGAFTLQAGEFMSYDMDAENSLFIDATAPLQVVQYPLGAADTQTPLASIYIPPVVRYAPDYMFTTPEGDRQRTHSALLIVESAHTSGIQLDTSPVSNTGWTQVHQSYPAYSVKSLEIGEGSHLIRHTDESVRFGVILFGFVNETFPCSYGLPAAMDYTLQDVPGTARPPMILPGPQLNVTYEGCAASTQGTEFVLMYMENGDMNLELQVIPALVSAEQITVWVRGPGLGEEDEMEVEMRGGEVQVLELPPQLMARGTEKAYKGVHVTASAPIGLYGFNKYTGSCDGFMVIPVESLGTEYRVMAYHDENSQFGVVALENNTEVQIDLPGRNFTIEYDGKTYGARDSIALTLNALEVFQAQDPLIDITGAYIHANQKIAAFSGNKLATVELDLPLPDQSHLVEMLFPISSWGTEFYHVPLPGRVQGDTLKIVAHYPNTQFVAAIPNNRIYQPGETTWSSFPTGINTKITSNRPISLGQFGQSLQESDNTTRKDPALLLLPPRDTWLSGYTFATPFIRSEEVVHHLLLVIDLRDSSVLTLNGEPLTGQGWDIFAGTSLVGRDFDLAAGIYHVESSNGATFGAYVYGSGSSDCAYAYPAGMCFTREEPTTAAPETTTMEATTTTMEATTTTMEATTTTMEATTTTIEATTTTMEATTTTMEATTTTMEATTTTEEATTTTHIITTDMTTPFATTVTFPSINCSQERLDLVVMVETSGNMDTQPDRIEENFVHVKELIVAVLKPLNVGLNKTRVGLVAFSSEVQNVFYLDTHLDKAAMLEAVRDLQYEGGYPNTAAALHMLRVRQFSAAAGDRPHVSNVAVVITYCASVIDSQLTIPRALEAQAAGIHIYAVGVSYWTQLAIHELQTISSPPRIRGATYFLPHDFPSLPNVARNLNVYGDACTLDCSCTDVVVTSEDLQPEYSGVFRRQMDQLNERPVFRHERCELYLYYLNDSADTGFWIFSPEKGRVGGFIMMDTEVEEPQNDNGTWRAFNEGQGMWEDDSTVTVECECTEPTCPQLHVVSAVEGESVPGVFTITSTLLNSHNVYQNEDLYLYYYVSDTCQLWVIGPSLGSEVGIMYVYDVSRDPSEITGTWTILIDSEWRQSTSVGLSCL